MTIRQRLTLWYGGVLLLVVVLTAAMMYFELIVERGWREAEGQPHVPVTQEIAEVVAYCLLPLTLVAVCGGWWLLQRSLRPLERLLQDVEQLRADNLSRQLPRTGNRDEVDRLTEALNLSHARLEDSFRRVREFTIGASHELRTPLAVIHGEIEMALNSPGLSPEHREMFAGQLDEIQRLTRIVSDLSLLAKVDAGRVSLAQMPVRLDELVRESFGDAQILAQAREVCVSLDRCEATTILGDRHRIRQLLLALTDNAVKYNHPGGRVEYRLTVERGGVLLEIGNTGKGVPPELVPRVFDRFFRANQECNMEAEGSGLGLSIAKWIVESHQGSIEFVSDYGVYTRVRVRFPEMPPAETLAGS
jgi:signal transduction histidine kinase